MTNDNTIAENIKRIRLRNHLTQEQLAEKIDRSKQTVSKWENGETTPNREAIYKLAQVFDIPEATILYGYTSETNTTNEEMKKVYDAINSINMRISLISNNMVTERYMNSSKSKEGYYKEEFVKYMNQFDEPEMPDEERWFEEYEKSMDEQHVFDAIGEYDFDGAINICDSHISNGDAEFAITAIQAYDSWHRRIPYEDENEYIEDMEEQSKYAKIYIHYLMKRFHITTEELLPI